MIKIEFKYIILLIINGLIGTQTTIAQRDTLKKEVEVIKAYKPTISDANKINDIPGIQDEEQKKPVFNYDINSRPVFSAFSISTLKAATIEGKPQEDYGLGLVKAGLGNYNKPYGEFFFNNRQTRNTFFGMHFKHLSSHGKLSLPGGDRVKAPMSDNLAEMFLKYMKGNSTLSLNLNFTHNGFNYYGYPVDTVPLYLETQNNDVNNYFGEKQAFSKGSFNINLVNSKPDRDLPTLGFDFTYSYFGTKTGQREHLGDLMVNIRKPFDPVTGLLDIGATFYHANGIDLLTTENGTRQQTWLYGKPAVYFGNATANLTVGGKIWILFDNYEKMKIRMAPNIRANFAPVREVINIFAGIDGNYINNHYSKIAYENQFVDPEHDVKGTMQRFRYFGGFDGKFSKKTNFKISAEYSINKDQPLYYLFSHIFPTMGPMPGQAIVQNDFKILYESLNTLKFNAEIFHTTTRSFDLLISTNYYKYNTSEQEFAWNLPEFDANLSVGYKINDQLTIFTDLFLIGERNALVAETIGFGDPVPFDELLELSSVQFKKYVLDTVFDMNFKAQYKISSRFSIFAQLNNFGFQSYQRWFGYPVQSFNFLGGLSYAF